MKHPTRLRDDTSASPELRLLVGSARWSRPMSSELRARSATRLDRAIALPAAAGLVFWLKGAAIAAGLGVAGVVGVIAVGRLSPSAPEVRDHATDHATREARESPLPSPARAPTAPVSSTSPAIAKALPAPPPPRDPVVPAAPGGLGVSPNVQATDSVQHSAPPEDPMAREAAMLEDARVVLERAPGEALSKLDAHAALFPAGKLALERELMAVDALRRLGRFAEARARGEDLLAHSRGSIYEERVRAMLAALPPASR